MNNKTHGRKLADKQRRIRMLGWVLLVFALVISCIAFAPEHAVFNSIITFKPVDQEGSYMMSIVFGVMGLFCLNSVRE